MAIADNVLTEMKPIPYAKARALVQNGDLLLCSAQHVAQGQQARGELVKDYRAGTLNGAAFRASVNRVIALRQSLK